MQRGERIPRIPCLYFNTFTVHTPTPDGTADWNQWTLATLGYAGGTGMFLWNESTGALYLWAGLTAADNGDGTGTLSYTQYRIAAHWHTGKPLATLEAADINGDGVPDLWTVTPAGAAQAYLVSRLSANGSAQIRAEAAAVALTGPGARQAPRRSAPMCCPWEAALPVLVHFS